MGLPALRHEARTTRAHTPRLRVVKSAPHKPQRKRSAAARAEAARSAFRTFALLTLIVSVLGIGRVWLSVQAAQASMDASRLRSDIKNERYEGDMLEVRQSALGSPSRIRAIAGQAMNMAPARKVTYLDLNEGAPGKAVALAQPSGQSQARKGVSGMVASMMDLTAGEAQVLLVGDVGLSSSK